MCFPIPFKKGLGPNTFNRWLVLFSPSARSCRAFVELSHVSGVPRKWGYTVEALRAHFRLCLARANGEGYFFFPFFSLLFVLFISRARVPPHNTCASETAALASRRRRCVSGILFSSFLVDMCVCAYSHFFSNARGFHSLQRGENRLACHLHGSYRHCHRAWQSRKGDPVPHIG